MEKGEEWRIAIAEEGILKGEGSEYGTYASPISSREVK